MNIDSCANCLLHGWNQAEDHSTLQRCKRCKLIKYCGRECQTEHWLKVHHKQCKYFADPAKAQPWDHKEDNCFICRQSAVMGKSQLIRPDNPNYVCTFEEAKRVPSYMIHSHPFPVTGDPEDTYEKATILLWQLMDKFQLTQPGAILNCREKYGEVLGQLKMNRLLIWRARKISPKSKILKTKAYPVGLLASFDEEVTRTPHIGDSFELWKMIVLISKIALHVFVNDNLNILLNPLADMPTEFHALVSQGVSNSAKFLSTVNQVLAALSAQVIPYRDVLAIICGGSLQKRCTFCSKEIIIADVAVDFSDFKGPVVLFGCLCAEIYCCESDNCLENVNSMTLDLVRSTTAVLTAVGGRMKHQCDFCYKLPPSADVHRCSRCLSVRYCSTDCRDQDWEIHKKVCKEDVEERKKKFGRSARRKEARDTLDGMEEDFEEANVPGAMEVVGKFKLKKATKSSK